MNKAIKRASGRQRAWTRDSFAGLVTFLIGTANTNLHVASFSDDKWTGL